MGSGPQVQGSQSCPRTDGHLFSASSLWAAGSGRAQLCHQLAVCHGQAPALSGPRFPRLSRRDDSFTWACAGGWAGCLHLTRSEPRPSPPRRGFVLAPSGCSESAKLPPEHTHHRPRLPHLCNGSVLAPRRHRRERAVETGVAQPGRPSSHVRVHLCVCMCVYTEVHTENRCCDKRPPVKMPLPPTHRGDP